MSTTLPPKTPKKRATSAKKKTPAETVAAAAAAAAAGAAGASGGMAPDENSIFEMLNQVNRILKENPAMVHKVNKCVSSIIDNKDLMTTLASEIKNNIEETPTPEAVQAGAGQDAASGQDQTLESNTPTDASPAS